MQTETLEKDFSWFLSPNDEKKSLWLGNAKLSRRFRAGLCTHEVGNDDVLVVSLKCRDVVGNAKMPRRFRETQKCCDFFRAGLCTHEVGNDDVLVVLFTCREVVGNAKMSPRSREMKKCCDALEQVCASMR